MSGFCKLIKGTAAATKVTSTAMGGFDTIALVNKSSDNDDIPNYQKVKVMLFYSKICENISQKGLIFT